MKYLKFLLILVALFLVHSCGLRVDLFEIATNVPEMQIKSGPLLLPNNTGRYNFGDVSIFSSEYAPFTIENSGDAKLRITGISFVEEDATCFSIDTTSMSSVLDKEQSTTFNIYFKPVAEGYVSARVILISNDPQKKRYIFTIEGYGTGAASGYPAIYVLHGNYELPEGGFYDFGSVTAGTLSTIIVTVENRGTADLQIIDLYITPDSSTERGEFYTIAPTVPSGVEPDENIRFTLTFNPKSAGYRSAIVTIMSDDPARQEYSFTVMGEGKAAPVPDIKVIQNFVDIPAEIGMYDFGSVWTEDINPPSVQFSIENTGATALIVSSIGFVTPPSGQFFISSTVPITVDPGMSVPFSVRFDPSTPGDLSDEVEIINDDPDENPYIFTVRGYGATSPVPDINVQEIANGSTFDLGPVPLSSSASQSFTIENTGTEDLQIYSIISKYPTYFAIDTSSTDITVSPATSTTFSVIFSPTDTKLRKSFIEIESNDNDVRPYRFTITGYGSKGSEPDIYVRQAVTCYPDGSTYFFPDTPVGTASSPITFTIENKGSGDLVITGIFLKGKLDDYSLGVPASSFTLSEGEGLTATITFTPTKLKKRSASLIIESDDPDESEYKVNLEGYGI